MNSRLGRSVVSLGVTGQHMGPPPPCTGCGSCCSVGRCSSGGGFDPGVGTFQDPVSGQEVVSSAATGENEPLTKKCKTFFLVASSLHLYFGSWDVCVGFGPEFVVLEVWRSRWAQVGLRWRSPPPPQSRAMPVREGEERASALGGDTHVYIGFVLWRLLSTVQKCSRTPAESAPRSGSGRPCGPPCSRSRSQGAAAWGRTRWPRSGWSFGSLPRGRSPWREDGILNNL